MRESKSLALPLGDTPKSEMSELVASQRSVVRLKRFELPTLALEGRCSIQLSYKRTNLALDARCGASDGNRTHVTSLEG